jgi:hypothetical protein
LNEITLQAVVSIALQKTVHPSARPAIALGLTFLLIGISYALPIRLVPHSSGKTWPANLPVEVVNVYACVAWAGWAHFIYAFRGQANGLKRLGTRREALFALAVLVALGVLFGLRSVVGLAVFGGVVWAYFIDHFLKAERMFEQGVRSEGFWARWVGSFRPVLTFAWLSVVLLNLSDIDSRRWVLIAISGLLAVIVLVANGWKELQAGDVKAALLSLFFIGEALVWGTFSAYGGPIFLTGVYVFHIAAASYFHYLGSYIYAFERSSGRDRFLTPLAIVGVNAGLVLLGWLAARYVALAWLVPVIGIQWFTLWVALHLVSSDLFPAFKRAPATG